MEDDDPLSAALDAAAAADCMEPTVDAPDPLSAATAEPQPEGPAALDAADDDPLSPKAAAPPPVVDDATAAEIDDLMVSRWHGLPSSPVPLVFPRHAANVVPSQDGLALFTPPHYPHQPTHHPPHKNRRSWRA